MWSKNATEDIFLSKYNALRATYNMSINKKDPVVTFFSIEHANWSSISGVMRGRSWKIEFGKLKIGVLAL